MYFSVFWLGLTNLMPNAASIELQKTLLCSGIIENDFTASQTVCFGDIWLIFVLLKKYHEQHF